MSSLDLYNWYENHFPNDFKQLIQIKHYSISDLSFLLSKIWCKLDHAEKLLMCAIYYDDFNLAKQMLNEKSKFWVNPFYGKRYFTTTPFRTYLSSSGSLTSSVADDYNEADVFNKDSANSKYDSIEIKHKCSKNDGIITKQCWCLNESFTNSRTSFSSYEDTESVQNDNDTEVNNLSQHFMLNSSQFSNANRRLNINPSNPTYYFDQILYDFYMQTPFYFAVKLNKLKMCQLFIDKIKSIFLTSLNAKIADRKKLYLKNENQRDYNVFYHHKACISSYLAKKNIKIYLNSMISDQELANLLVLALSNKNYDIAILIMSNVSNPKYIFNFKNLSESFIYNKEFCMYLVKNRIIEPQILLKESTNRHSASITNLIIEYIEQQYEYKNNTNEIFKIYKLILNNSISIGNLNIFKLALYKIKSFLDAKVNQNFSNTQLQVSNVLKDLTIEKILSDNYGSVLKCQRSSTLKSNLIDLNATKSLANDKGLNWESYFGDSQGSLSNDTTSAQSSLSYFNRLRLLNYLFDITSITKNNCRITENMIKSDLEKIWLNLEDSIIKKLKSFEKIFAPDDFKCALYTDKYQNFDSNQLTKLIQSKRVYFGQYLVMTESEPFLINELLKSSEENYELTNRDLINAAKNSANELTLYYLISKIQFDESANIKYLEPVDDIYGNFLEILFCRIVRCTHKEQEMRLRRLFFEIVLLNNAKMTCSTNMMSLFLTNDQYVYDKLVSKYFPCLFFLSKSFPLFKNDFYSRRFDLLTHLIIKNIFFAPKITTVFTHRSQIILNIESLSKEQKEIILFEYYKTRTCMPSNANALQLHNSRIQINFDMNLKELSRISFLSCYLKHGNSYLEFINGISDTARQFIFCFNEIKCLFS